MAERKGWRRVKFGDVVRLVTDRVADPVAEGIERYVGLEHIEPDDLRVRQWGLVADGTTFTNRFKPGQVLFGKRRAYQRKVVVADFEGVCSGDIYVFESASKELLPELLPFVCRSEAFHKMAIETSAGSLSPRTNWTSLSKFEFALPSQETQRDLARLMSACNDALAAHDTALAAAVSIRQSILHTLFDAEDAKQRGWPIRQVVNVGLSNAPTVQVGPFGGSLTSDRFVERGVPVIKVTAVGHSSEIDRAGLVYIHPTYAENFARYAVEANDIIIVAQGFTTGRSAVVDEAHVGAVISQHVVRVRVDRNTCRPEWMLAFCASSSFWNQIAPIISKTTRPGLNTSDVEALLFPLPDVGSQDAWIPLLHEATINTVQLAERVSALRQLQTESFSKAMECQ